VVEAFLLVKEPNYIPPGVVLRVRINDHLFTCSFKADQLPALEQDDLVQTISLAQRLRTADGQNKGSGGLRLLRQHLFHLAEVVEGERVSLPVGDQEVVSAWLRGLGPEAIAQLTGRPPMDIRNVTFQFRFRPAVWEAIHRVRQAVGSEGVSPLIGVVDVHNLEVLLLDDRERP
jgi:hypothetical protein